MGKVPRPVVSTMDELFMPYPQRCIMGPTFAPRVVRDRDLLAWPSSRPHASQHTPEKWLRRDNGLTRPPGAPHSGRRGGSPPYPVLLIDHTDDFHAWKQRFLCNFHSHRMPPQHYRTIMRRMLWSMKMTEPWKVPLDKVLFLAEISTLSSGGISAFPKRDELQSWRR